MNQFLIGAALVGGAAWLGQRRGSFGSVLPFEHPVIRLANEYVVQAQGVEVTTLFDDREPNAKNCAQEKRDLIKVKRFRMRLDAKTREFERSLTDESDDRLHGIVLWSLNRMDLGDTYVSHAEHNYKWACEDL